MMEMTPTVSPVTAMMMPITIHPAPVLRIVLYIFSIFIAFPVGNMLLCLGAILLIVSVNGCLYKSCPQYSSFFKISATEASFINATISSPSLAASVR